MLFLSLKQGPAGADGGSGAVTSVNGQIEHVVLTSADVGALSDTTVIPDLSGKADKTCVDAQDTAVASSAQAALVVHTSRRDNPHSVAKGQIGLGNVDYKSDLSKPVSTAQASINSAKVDKGSFINYSETVEQ